MSEEITIDQMVHKWKASDVKEKYEFLVKSDVPMEVVQAWVERLTEEEYQTIKEYANEISNQFVALINKVRKSAYLSSDRIWRRIV